MEGDADFSDEFQTDENSVSNVENAQLDAQFEEGNEVWKCSICTKEYSTKKNLKRHLVIVHEAGKSHICGKCDKKFGDRKELKGHVLSEHEGKKLFQCSICKASFNDSASIKVHLVSIHGKNNIMNCKPKELIRMNLCSKPERSQTCDQCE